MNTNTSTATEQHIEMINASDKLRWECLNRASALLADNPRTAMDRLEDELRTHGATVGAPADVEYFSVAFSFVMRAKETCFGASV